MNSEEINSQEQTHSGVEHLVDSSRSTEFMMVADQSLQLATKSAKGYKSTWIIILVIFFSTLSRRCDCFNFFQYTNG